MTAAVRAIGDPPRKSNAQMVADLHTVARLTDVPTLDCTYGEGRWWTTWRPATLIRCDIDPAKSPDMPAGVDFTNMPWSDGCWPQVTFDPPYKLNGTSAHPSDAGYGVAVKRTRDETHALMRAGLTECARVLTVGGVLVAKCQDQVESGRLWMQSHLMVEWGRDAGLELVDRIHVYGYRPQPARPNGFRSVHSDYSTGLVFRKAAQ